MPIYDSNPIHGFNVRLACEHGTDVAIFISVLDNHMRQYIDNQELPGCPDFTCLHRDGLDWMPFTSNHLQKLFPYWCRGQISQIKEQARRTGMFHEEDFFDTDRRIPTIWLAIGRRRA